VAVGGYSDALALWRKSAGAEPATGARIAVKLLLMYGRWAGGLSRVLPDEALRALETEARALLAEMPDAAVQARLACAHAFIATRQAIPRGAALEAMVADVEAARGFYRSRGDHVAESEALDALGAICRSGYGDYHRAIAYCRQRLANLERLSLLERVDAWAALSWDLVLAGQLDEASRVFDEARSVLRPGEPEYMLSHGASWAAYACMHLGRWDRALELGDFLLYVREEGRHTIGSGRFLFPGLLAVLRVAAARLDTTRLARYRSVFTAFADRDPASPGSALWNAFIDADAAQARACLAQPVGQRDRKGEVVALLLFELRESLAEEEIAAVESQASGDPPMLALRLALARALNAGEPRIREVVAALERAGMVADAARARMLLALRTREPADRAAAEAKLAAIGDRAFLQALKEEW
jgi:hypothetical protein